MLTVSTIQWVTVQLYTTLCSTWFIWGPFQNVLSLGSPACHVLNHLQVGLSNYYVTIWAGAAAIIMWISNRVSSQPISKK